VRASALVQSTLRAALTLTAFALIGTLGLAYVFKLTYGLILESQEKAKLELIASALPPGSFDNNLVRDAIPLPPHPLLGTERPGKAYPAFLQRKPTAVVLEAVAPEGYNGDIALLVAIKANGELVGVRVAAHKETPGLGDYIELAKSNWIRLFDGRSLDKVPEMRWRVKKDGGVFDYKAGATVTPRAVVKAVRNALLYFVQERERLLAEPAAAKSVPS
jgi:Na+-translocating ferredoxin:NAD+ oxidoreductase subunit G